MELLEPTLDILPGYLEALARGWSWYHGENAQAARVELETIRRDPAAYVASQVDREARGGPITLPDGSQVPRLPGYRLWMWDEGFCGSIGIRWQPGTHALPPHCLGHIGYSVVPWRQRQGHATRALGLMRAHARAEGLTFADLTTDLGNVASQKVIAANGGFALERFDKPASHGGAPSMRFRWYTGEPHPIERTTARLRLRQWREEDVRPFRELNADPVVMRYFPAPLTAPESDAWLERTRAAIELRGWGLWALERRSDARFLGSVGLTVVREPFPFVPAVEVGWRLARHAWGQGYATEAAREALEVAFHVLGLNEVVSFTAALNEPSMAVMRRLGMREAGTFAHPGIEPGHPLRPHRLFRLRRPGA